jgi:hypothetical protein
VTLTGSKGLLTLGQWSGLSLTTGDGWADATMTFTGTLADINAALDGLTFRGLANYNGPASLQITTCDLGNTGTGGAHSDTDTVAITVKSVYDPPTVAGRLKSLPQGGTLKFALADFAAGFTTVEAGKSLRKIQITSLPADGTLKLSGTAVAVGQEIAAASLPYLSYTPAAGYAGPDSFGWNGADGLSYAAIPATMNIVQQPTAAAFSRSFVLNTPLGFAQADFTTAFTDPSPGYSLGTVKITSLPIHGTLKLGGASVKLNQVIPLSQLDSLAYTPTTGFRGSDSFGWNGSDGRLYATTAAVVKLSYFDRPPVVADIAKSTPQNHLKALTFAAADFTGAAAFSDPDADSIQKVKITSLPANGLLKYLGVPVTVGKEITAGMIHYLTYTPTSGYLGPDSFGWNGSDGTQYAANPASVNLSVS